MTSTSLLENWPLRSCFKVGSNQKTHGVRSGLYAGCTLTSKLCRSSYSWTRWTVCGCALSWWSIYHSTNSGHFSLMYPNDFSNTEIYFLAFLYTFVCSSPLYSLSMPLLPSSSHGKVCPVGVSKPFFTKSSISRLVYFTYGGDKVLIGHILTYERHALCKNCKMERHLSVKWQKSHSLWQPLY